MSTTPRRLRLGMVGGGQGAFIGAVHRMAARLDDQWTLVAAALSSDAQRSNDGARALHLDPQRSYTDYRQMALAEAQRNAHDGSGIDAVAIVTPNHLHAPVAHAFLDAGIHVICDKPLALTLQDGQALAAKATARGLLLAVTYNYSGYPMVRHARQLVASGALGALRLVQVEYAQDWLSTSLEADGPGGAPPNKQAAWRTNPGLAGAAGCLGDIGTHAYQLACFVSGLQASEVSAELSCFGPGRVLDDNVQAMLRFPMGVRGSLWASQIAGGAVNGLRVRVFGELGGLSFSQEQPDELVVTRTGGDETRLRRGRTTHGPTETVRVPAGHPEGFIEAFATIYSDVASRIHSLHNGAVADTGSADLTTVADGVAGLAFVDAALRSAASNGAWTVVTG